MIAEPPSRGSFGFPEVSTRLGLGDPSSQICSPRLLKIAATSVVVWIAVAACYFGLGGERAGADRNASVDRVKTADADLWDEMATRHEKLALAASTGPQSKRPFVTGKLDAELDRASPENSIRSNRCGRVVGASRDRTVLDEREDVERRQKWSGLFHFAGLIETGPDEPAVVSPQPEAVISDAPPEPEGQSRSLAQLSHQAVAEAKRLLASTGLNVDRLFPQLGQDRGARGGPFVAPPKSSQPEDEILAKLEELRSLMRSLPLSVPLDYYQLESRFGPRHDPFNRRLAFHTGIDLSAPYMSPVRATAAGTVTFAGYRSDYGKVVEIDHGNGIATVYGHLHRAIVSVGQRVAERELIGLLGSSGRSSGPHVHYEILVNNEPQDPEKFIGLARVIPAAEK